VKIEQITIGWNVSTRWGRIGNTGTEQNRTFYHKVLAEQFAEQKVLEKAKKGYKEIITKTLVKVSQNSEIPTLSNTQSKSEVKLPRVWSKLQNDLLSGERVIYEKHNDKRTKQRRFHIASKWKLLISTPSPSEEIANIRKSAWLYLRYTYLRYLANVNSYTPAVQESARATVGLLYKKLQELPNNQKAVIDASLKKYSEKTGPLSLAECEAGVNHFVDTLTAEIKEKEKVGLGGVSRKRAKILARKLNKN